MSAEILPALSARSNAVVIFLHGLGDSGAGLSDVGRLIQRKTPWIKFVFPNAPIRPVTVNGGSKMRAWFDIKSFGGSLDSNEIKESVKIVENIAKPYLDEKQNVVICGFSQGAVVTTYLSLVSSKKYSGFGAFSSRLVEPSAEDANNLDINRSTPFIAFHGVQDPVLSYEGGVHAQKTLVEKYKRTDLSFKSYQGEGHNISYEMINEFVGFLNKTLPAPSN